MAKGGSKNNVSNRGVSAKLRKYNNKEVKPAVLFNGRKLVVAQYVDNGKVALDPAGNPVLYQQANV